MLGALALIVGGISLLKRSAKPFKLSKDQWQQVKNRVKEQDVKDDKD